MKFLKINVNSSLSLAINSQIYVMKKYRYYVREGQGLQCKTPWVIKIDVEGTEYKGSDNNRPIIIYNEQDIVETTEAFDYNIYYKFTEVLETGEEVILFIKDCCKEQTKMP